MPTIEYKEECPECKGTGVFVGWAEGKGFGIHCHACNGTGCHKVKLEYTEFTERKRLIGIVQVLELNPGCRLEGPNFGAYGGLPYDAWFNGAKFDESTWDRAHLCPSAYCQNTGRHKPEWNECKSCLAFIACAMWSQKDVCWARFNAERKGGKR